MEVTQFKSTLDWGSKKFRCPQCGKNTFVRFRNRENGEYNNEEYGRCDREVNCGYFQQPSQLKCKNEFNPPIPKPRIYFPESVFSSTLTDYENNSFFNVATAKGLPSSELSKIFKKYRIGTLTKGNYKGAICFPFINRYGLIEAVQCKTFSDDFHTEKTNWLHSILSKTLDSHPQWLTDYMANDGFIKCLFGEHLLKEDRDSPVIIVESPKNAILGSLLLPEYIWLASISLRMLKADRLKVLTGRRVLLIPDTSKDASAFEIWNNEAIRAEKLYNTKFEVSRFFEDNTTEEQKAKGYDIADYIIDHVKELQAEKSKIEKKQYKDLTKEERLKIGLKIFNIADLQKLSKRIASNWTDYQLIIKKLINEGMTQDDAEDILDIMCIRNVLQVGDFAYKAN